MLNYEKFEALTKVCITLTNKKLLKNSSYIIQLLDETEQNIVIYQWRADQLFADAEGRGK